MKPHSDLQWWQASPPVQSAAAPAVYVAEQGRVAFWALICFTFILLIAPQAYFPFLAPFRIALLAAGAAFIAQVAGSMAVGQQPFHFRYGARYVMLLLAWSVLTLPFAFWPGGSVSYLLESFLKTVIVFMLLASVINSRAKLRIICWSFVLMAAHLALTTVRNYAGGVFLGNADRVTGTQGALTGNPNDMALMLNLILPLAIALFLLCGKGWQRLMLGAIIGLLIAAIIVTYSRAGFLTLCVIMAVYLWRLRASLQKTLIPLVLLFSLGALPFMPAGYMDRIGTITDIEEDETGSAQERMDDMKLATSLALRDPFIGAGIGNSIHVMDEARGRPGTKIHNVYLEYAVELGAAGLLLYLLLFFACLRNTRYVLIRTSPGDGSKPLYYLAEGLRISLIGFIVSAFFHPVAYHFYFFLIAGLAVAVRAVYEKEHETIAATVAE
jgi:putative inorganic carbon (hco3(-)) transporter